MPIKLFVVIIIVIFISIAMRLFCWKEIEKWTLLHGQTLIPAWISNYIIIKCQNKLLIHSQTLTMQPLKFGNAYVISSQILLAMWLLIHTGIKGVRPNNDCHPGCRGKCFVTKMWSNFAVTSQSVDFFAGKEMIRHRIVFCFNFTINLQSLIIN